MDTSATQTLKQIVKGITLQGYGLDNWKFIGQYAIDAIREVHMYHTSERYKIAKVVMDPNTNTFDWPTDYIGLVYIGIPDNGRVCILTRDNEIIPTTTLVNGQETLDSTKGEGVLISSGQTEGYGARGGKNTFYYSADELNRRFIINGTNPANILLAYTSSGVADKDTLIPVKFKLMIDYFARWKLNERPPENLKLATYYEDQYYKEVNKLKLFEAPSLPEIYDAWLSEYSGAIRR